MALSSDLTKNAEGQTEGNTTRSRVYSPNNNIRIAEHLLSYQNMLHIELNAILIAIKTIQTTQLDMHLFTDNLNNTIFIKMRDFQ